MFDFSKTIELKPDFPEAYFHRARIWVDNKDYKSALADLDDYIELAPEDAVGYYERGRVKMFENNLKDACTDFTTSYQMGYKEAKSLIDDICKPENINNPGNGDKK